MILRPHQAKNKDELRQELRRVRATMLVAECGYGKGVIVADLIANAVARGKYILFLVHGRDRVNDMDERVTNLGIPHGVLMGGKRRDRQHAVQIASSDTVYRMEFKPKASVIIIDECHLAMSPTFRAVLDFYAPDPESDLPHRRAGAMIIGMTATPMLGTGKALGVKSGGIFESMVKGPSVNWLIKNGHLVGSRVFRTPPPPGVMDMKKKRTGEFDSSQGAAICDNRKVIGDIVDHWERHSPDRKTAVFGFDQKHANDIAEMFRSRGHNWAYVDADTPDGNPLNPEPGTRRWIWNQYDKGDLVGVSSVGCIDIGWDHSICKCLILASKTASFPRYRQRLGRGSRPHKGYSDFLVLDHCGNFYEHEERGSLFESEVDWQLDGDAVKIAEDDGARRSTKCITPVLVPDAGKPVSFQGQVKRIGGRDYMLPCLNPFTPGPRECPYCGIPLERDERPVEVEAGDLEEVTPEMRRAAEDRIRAESVRKAEYLDLVRLAQAKGYKAGYPSVVFKSKHGFWPPKGWKGEVERLVGEVA